MWIYSEILKRVYFLKNFIWQLQRNIITNIGELSLEQKVSAISSVIPVAQGLDDLLENDDYHKSIF
jgi:hypothetical protein